MNIRAEGLVGLGILLEILLSKRVLNSSKYWKLEKFEIKCPCCGWQPDPGAFWGCTCGHIWNTFDTYGICPACNKQWRDTQCLEDFCNQWSKHEDWYVVPIDFDKLLEGISNK